MFKNKSYLENKDSKFSNGETKKFKDYLKEHSVNAVVDFVEIDKGVLFVMEYNNEEYSGIFDNTSNSKLSFNNLIFLIFNVGVLSKEEMRSAKKS